MSDYQKIPLKVYIQDIFRAIQSSDNKYVYELFGLKFKNINIHGVVTAIYNTTGLTTNLEISDPTGTIQVYYDSTKNNSQVPKPSLKRLCRNYTERSQFGDDNIQIITKLTDCLAKNKNPIQINIGSYISIIGDIFVDDKNIRMVSAYEYNVTSPERDIIWMEELRYLYDKYYLRQPVKLNIEI